METCTSLGMMRPLRASTFRRTACATEMALAPGRLAMLRVTAGCSVADGRSAPRPLPKNTYWLGSSGPSMIFATSRR